METEKGLILRHGHAAGRLGDTAGPVVVERKDGREETTDPGMDEVMQKVAAAACHRNGRESAHVRVMGAEPLDEGICGRMEVIRQRVGMDDLMGHSDRFLPGLYHEKLYRQFPVVGIVFQTMIDKALLFHGRNIPMFRSLFNKMLQ
jgi:hypothetical protein